MANGRIRGGEKSVKSRVELAEVRAKAYQFIRQNPNITPREVASRFNINSSVAGGWISHCRKGSRDLFTKTLPGETQEVNKTTTMELTFDQAAEAIIFAFEQAKIVPSLKKRIYRLENILAATKNELDNFRKYSTEKEDQVRRFKLAQQQGDISQPLTEGGNIK